MTHSLLTAGRLGLGPPVVVALRMKIAVPLRRRSETGTFHRSWHWHKQKRRRLVARLADDTRERRSNGKRPIRVSGDTRDRLPRPGAQPAHDLLPAVHRHSHRLGPRSADEADR